MNIGAPWLDPVEAEQRVRVMQTKLHQWAKADPGRCFDDLYNLVYDPSFLMVAWRRVRSNKGARTGGVDGITPRSLGTRTEKLLIGLRDDLKARRFAPQPVRQKTIPKASGKVRSLGDPYCCGSGCAGLVETDARTDLRGELQTMLVWFSNT